MKIFIKFTRNADAEQGLINYMKWGILTHFMLQNSIIQYILKLRLLEKTAIRIIFNIAG